MRKMTDEDLKAIAARAAAATEGPWRSSDLGPCDGMQINTMAKKFQDPDWCIVSDGGEMSEENSEFIAHARTDVPALLEEVKRLQDVAYEQRRQVVDRNLEIAELKAEIARLKP
jgi:hypothetical protein